jgi:hypothetical protein
LKSGKHCSVLCKKEYRKEGDGESSHRAIPVIKRERSWEKKGEREGGREGREGGREGREGGQGREGGRGGREGGRE